MLYEAEFLYNNSYYIIISYFLFKALYKYYLRIIKFILEQL
jgi:hypothetical protein